MRGWQYICAIAVLTTSLARITLIKGARFILLELIIIIITDFIYAGRLMTIKLVFLAIVST